MAKFIEVYSSGSGLDGGNVLIGVENIVGVDAINYALTANPGGVKAKVQLPSGITVSNIVWS
jgi:hypothetical protein